MIEYRRKKEEDKESFILFGTDVFKEPGFQGFVFNLVEIPFLATSTRRCFDSVVLYPHFPLSDEEINQVFECTNGWEKVPKEEYDKAFDEALSDFIKEAQ